MRSPDAHRPMARGAHGFTLFEVLAAALVLVLAGVLAIGSMNTNLSHLSDARVRLEAGRIADATLADIEATLVDGSAPPISSEESTVGPFRVSVRVIAFGGLFDAGEIEASPDEGSPGLFGTIAQELPGVPRFLRAIQVRVGWGPVDAPEFVERTTIAFDQVGALQALEEQAGGGEADE